MKCYVDKEKRAIKDLSIFKGLAVDTPRKFRNLFLHPQFTLLVFEYEQAKAFVVFEEYNKGFIFHLVNFTQMNTRTMTEHFIENHVIPYCKARGLTFIQARSEREGMTRKLVNLGFEAQGDILRKEV